MSALATTNAPTTAAPPAPSRYPANETLAFAFRLSLEGDKPILTDYWEASLLKQAFIGVRGEGDSRMQLLVKSEDEYTSPIKKLRKHGSEFIVETENSIYIVDAATPAKKIA